MLRTPLETLALKGTATDIAYQLGKRRARKIAPRVAYWKNHVRDLFNGKTARLKTLEAAFLKEAQKQAPQALDEIRALAEGAGLAFADVFRLNLTELNTFAEKCTTVA